MVSYILVLAPVGFFVFFGLVIGLSMYLRMKYGYGQRRVGPLGGAMVMASAVQQQNQQAHNRGVRTFVHGHQPVAGHPGMVVPGQSGVVYPGQPVRMPQPPIYQPSAPPPPYQLQRPESGKGNRSHTNLQPDSASAPLPPGYAGQYPLQYPGVAHSYNIQGSVDHPAYPQSTSPLPYVNG